MSAAGIAYVARRIALLVPMWFAISFVVFTLIHLAPGDPVIFILGDREYDVEVGKRIRAEYHLDEPIPIQYLYWLGPVVRGDFGKTMDTKRPVIDVVREASEVTISLAVLGLLLTVVVGVPIGVLAAIFKGTWKEYALMTTAFLAVSTPSFLVALILILVFSERLHLLPSIGYVSFRQDPVEWLRHMILPAVGVGLFAIASIARMVRTSLLEVLGRDFVLTARAKGVFEQLVIVRHALSNALIPTVTVLGLFFGSLLAGSVFIETVFALPGLGRTSVEALGARNFPLIQFNVLVIATIHIVVNLLTDLLYAQLDPRIKYA
jgi:peptide/nickel transport system permease protein